VVVEQVLWILPHLLQEQQTLAVAEEVVVAVQPMEQMVARALLSFDMKWEVLNNG